MNADDAARKELQDLKNEYDTKIQMFKESRVSPEEERGQLKWLSEEKRGFLYRHAHRVSHDTIDEIIETFRLLRIELEAALRKGREKFDDEKHRRRIENIRAFEKILVIAVAVILFVVVKILFNIEIPFLS
jgi:hypothetical protein